MKEKINGRPRKEIEDKLCCSINLKFKVEDYCAILDKAERLAITPTAYARAMVIKGEVKAPFSADELTLMRQLAGEANNLNQIAKHLNSGSTSYILSACAIINRIKKMIYDSKKY